MDRNYARGPQKIRSQSYGKTNSSEYQVEAPIRECTKSGLSCDLSWASACLRIASRVCPNPLKKTRPMRATAIAALVFSAFMLGNMAPRLTSLGRPSEQTGFGPLNVCTGAAGSAGVQSDLMRDGIEVAT